LLLCRDKLCVEKIHLLGWHHVVHHGVRLARSRRLSSDVVQSILVVGFEVGVLEFPRTSSVRRHAALFIVVPDFVEIVFVELTHETGKVAVLEVLGQDMLCEFLVLQVVWLAKA
jgi:hypothetical protein